MQSSTRVWLRLLSPTKASDAGIVILDDGGSSALSVV